MSDWEDVPLDSGDDWEDVPLTQAQAPQSEGLGKQLLRSSIDAIPAAGGIAGGLIGGTAGIPSGPGAIATGVGGAALGYGLGAEARDLARQYLLGEKPTANAYDQPIDTAKRVGVNLAEGAMGEMGGQILGKGVSAAVQKGAPLVAKGLQKASDATSRALPKFGKIAAEVPEQFTEEYLSRGGALNFKARTESDILDDLTSRYGAASKQVDDAKGAVSLKRDAVRDAKTATQNEFRDRKFLTSNARAEAKAELDATANRLRENLKSANLTGYKQPVLDDIAALKEKVSRGSQESYNILDSDPNAYGVRRAGQVLRVMADEMNIQPFGGAGALAPAGTVNRGAPVTAQTAGVQASMRDFAKRLEGTPEKIPARELKKILQQIDESEKAIYGQPGFDGRVSRAYKLVRKTIDDAVKAANPEYALKMEEVAENTGLLNEAIEAFGSESKAIGRLNSIGSQRGRDMDIDLLKRLGSKTGSDYETPIQSYLDSQDVLATPSKFNERLMETPEYSRFQMIDEDFRALQDPMAMRNIDAAPNVASANAALGEAEGALNQAQSNFDVFAPVSPGSAQAKLRALYGARDYNPKQIFGKIDEATGHDFSGEIKDRAILDSFNKGSTNGARKTMMGTALGTSVGSAMGPVGAAVGGAIGGGVGFAADKYAGKMFRSMLDGKISADIALKTLGPKLGAYGPILQQAAQRGSQGLASTHFVLEQTDPVYREMIRSVADRDQQGE